MNRYLLFFTLILIQFTNLCYGQGRSIDAEIFVAKPIAGETIISRKDGKYVTELIIKNNGPDSIKIGDKYFISITFGNVIYPSFFKYPLKTIAPNSIDTITETLQMIWDADAIETKFCGNILLVNNTKDSIKKENKTLIKNNTFCQIVAHDSRLFIKQLLINNLKIYPNPCNDFLTIENEEANLLGNSTISIYNLAGQEILAINQPIIRDNKLILDLKILPKGTYLIKVTNEFYNKKSILVIN
jgi:hypothetical protein